MGEMDNHHGIVKAEGMIDWTRRGKNIIDSLANVIDKEVYALWQKNQQENLQKGLYPPYQKLPHNNNNPNGPWGSQQQAGGLPNLLQNYPAQPGVDSKTSVQHGTMNFPGSPQGPPGQAGGQARGWQQQQQQQQQRGFSPKESWSQAEEHEQRQRQPMGLESPQGQRGAQPQRGNDRDQGVWGSVLDRFIGGHDQGNRGGNPSNQRDLQRGLVRARGDDNDVNMDPSASAGQCPY